MQELRKINFKRGLHLSYPVRERMHNGIEREFRAMFSYDPEKFLMTSPPVPGVDPNAGSCRSLERTLNPQT